MEQIVAYKHDPGWSIEPLDPMRGVLSAVTRMNIQRMEPTEGWLPEQKLTLWESIYYYTYGSAYADHLENVKGSLAAGRLGDCIVMDRNLFTVPPAEILDAKVDYTIVGGEIGIARPAGTGVRRSREPGGRPPGVPAAHIRGRLPAGSMAGRPSALARSQLTACNSFTMRVIFS